MEARIFYDFEIEHLKKEGGTNTLNLVSYLSEEFPRASLTDVLYTIEEFIKEKGPSGGFPLEILRKPEEVVEVVEEEEPEEEIEEISEVVEEDVVVSPSPERRNDNFDVSKFGLLRDLNKIQGLSSKRNSR